MTALELLARGGPMMVIVLLCSLLTVYKILERFFVYRKIDLDTDQFMLKVRSIYHDGDADSVVAFCGLKSTPVSNVVKRALLKRGDGEVRMREATLIARSEEKAGLEKGVFLLRLSTAFTPLVGLLGTLYKLFRTFLIGSVQISSEISFDLRTVSWALLPLGLSLLVAIVGLIFSAYFNQRTSHLMLETDRAVGDLFDLLAGKPIPKHAATPEVLAAANGVVPGATAEFMAKDEGKVL